MSKFRDIKRKARLELHSRMFLDALYLVPGALPSDPYTETAVKVRLHYKFDPLGELLNSGYAERAEVRPRIVFLRSEVDSPVRNSLVSIETGDAYRIEIIEPADDITVTAVATRLSAAQAAGLPVPGV